jgi:GGDEF domain-containing protein
MATQTQLGTVVHDGAVGELQDALSETPDAYRLMCSAWEWFSAHALVDVLGVATLGPPEPIGYLFSEGPLDSGAQHKLWQDLVSAATAAQPQPGMYPRRAGDRRTWCGSSPLPAFLERPETLGPWVVRAGGGPAAAVMAWKEDARPVSSTVSVVLPAAATCTALYLRNIQWLDIDPDPEPTEPMTFEELLESEVSRSRRKRVPVSLALIEYRRNEGSPYDWDVPLELQEEVEGVIRRTARKGDRVMRISDSCLAVVMPKTDARGALVGADRLQKELCGYFDGRAPRLSVRIGIGGRDPEESQASELFARASQALAEARSAHGEAAFLHI